MDEDARCVSFPLSYLSGKLSDRIISGGAICVGGPAFTRWVQPTDEELFQKYNPELQKRSLERRVERQQEFDDFVTKLKEYSKSDKPSTFLKKVESDVPKG